jgi:hypothetical protein
LDAAATVLPPEREDMEQQELVEATRETAYGFVVSERQPLLFEGGALRPYQLDGLDWLKVLRACARAHTHTHTHTHTHMHTNTVAFSLQATAIGW